MFAKKESVVTLDLKKNSVIQGILDKSFKQESKFTNLESARPSVLSKMSHKDHNVTAPSQTSRMHRQFQSAMHQNDEWTRRRQERAEAFMEVRKSLR